MPNVSDLERKMLQCDKQCAEHDITKSTIKELKNCLGNLKEKVNRLSARVSWLVGVMVLAGFLVGYGFNSIHSLEDLTRVQEGINKTLQTSNLRLPAIIRTQDKTSVSIAKIQQTMYYMKQDIVEIKKILRKKN
jgi:hypothetical protein